MEKYKRALENAYRNEYRRIKLISEVQKKGTNLGTIRINHDDK